MTVVRSLIKPGQTEGEIAYWDATEMRWEGGGGLGTDDFVQKAGDTMTGTLVMQSDEVPLRITSADGLTEYLKVDNTPYPQIDISSKVMLHKYIYVYDTVAVATTGSAALEVGDENFDAAFTVDTPFGGKAVRIQNHADLRGYSNYGYAGGGVQMWSIQGSTGNISTVGDYQVGANSILTSSLHFVIDGSGSVITAGVKGDMSIPFKGTLTGVRLLADQSGSMNLDLWKAPYNVFPPLVVHTITAATHPRLTNQISYEDTILPAWTTTVAAGDIIRFNVISASLVTRVTVALTIVRTA